MLTKASSITEEFDETLYSLFDEYEAKNTPIAVDFRQLVSEVTFGTRASHKSIRELKKNNHPNIAQ